MSSPVEVIREDRALAVVRADAVADAGALAGTLAGAGLRAVEFTFTTPDCLRLLEDAARTADRDGAVVGAGTVLTRTQAQAAVSAGARFLVTPCLRHEVAGVAAEQGITLFMGALSPTEVLQAHEAGAAAVKVFPAGRLGPVYLKDLRGPFPEVDLLPSGGVTEQNAADFLRAGAVAVCAGSGVVPAAEVAAGDWAGIERRARSFVASLQG